MYGGVDVQLQSMLIFRTADGYWSGAPPLPNNHTMESRKISASSENRTLNLCCEACSLMTTYSGLSVSLKCTGNSYRIAYLGNLLDVSGGLHAPAALPQGNEPSGNN